MANRGYFNIIYRGFNKIHLKISNNEITQESERNLYSLLFFQEKLQLNKKEIKWFIKSICE